MAPKLTLAGRTLSKASLLGIVLVVVGFGVLIMAYDAQTGIDEIGETDDPDLQERLDQLVDQRDVYLVISIGLVFMGLFALAILGEPNMPRTLSEAAMISGARASGDTLKGLSISGNSAYLPAKHGLTKERVLIVANKGEIVPPGALSDDLLLSPGKDGSSPGIVMEPYGLMLLDRVESDLGSKLSDAGLESAEGMLQMLKHGMGMMRDFHFKERDGKTVLRVEYSGLLEACRTVRKERPDTCRQMQCVGCSCLLAAAARATGKAVSVEDVDNSKDGVVFTLVLKEW